MCPAALNMFWTAIRSPMSGGMPSILGENARGRVGLPGGGV